MRSAEASSSADEGSWLQPQPQLLLAMGLGTLLFSALCLGAARAVIFEGDAPFREEALCVPEDSGQMTGACWPLGDCPPWSEDAAGCGLPGADLQCCRLYADSSRPGSSRSRRACQEFAKPKERCDNFQPPAAGPEVRPGDFPYFAALGYKTKSGDEEDSWLCGGALISENFVLTAASCVGENSGGPVKVRLGGVSLSKDAGADEQELDVAEIIVHPAYNASSKLGDIALLRLAGNARFSRTVQPACLFPEERMPVNRAVVAGFGFASWVDIESSGTLRKVDVPLLPFETCSKMYKILSHLDTTHSTLLCAGEKGRDTCKGDSGAPLVVKEGAPTCNYQIAGITSFGFGICGSKPGIYTRVKAYLLWIEKNVWQ